MSLRVDDVDVRDWRDEEQYNTPTHPAISVTPKCATPTQANHPEAYVLWFILFHYFEKLNVRVQCLFGLNLLVVKGYGFIYK